MIDYFARNNERNQIRQISGDCPEDTDTVPIDTHTWYLQDDDDIYDDREYPPTPVYRSETKLPSMVGDPGWEQYMNKRLGKYDWDYIWDLFGRAFGKQT